MLLRMLIVFCVSFSLPKNVRLSLFFFLWLLHYTFSIDRGQTALPTKIWPGEFSIFTRLCLLLYWRTSVWWPKKKIRKMFEKIKVAKRNARKINLSSGKLTHHAIEICVCLYEASGWSHRVRRPKMCAWEKGELMFVCIDQQTVI